MEFKNSKEIIEHSNYLLKEEKQIQKNIDDYKTLKKIDKSKKIKTYCDRIIKKSKEKLININESLEECNNLIIEFSSFPTSMLMKFLKDTIEHIENKEYSVTALMFTESIKLIENYNANFTIKYLIFDSNYLASEKKLEESFITRHLEYFYRELLKDSKYILLPNNEKTNLLYISGLSNYFCNFPYLEEIAYDLVDRRLLEPEKDLQNILNDELEIIKTIKPKKLTKEENK